MNDYDEVVCIHGSKKGRKLKLGATGHIPNKDEARILRKIMATTGLTEEEVRADKKYRIALSDAQKVGQKAKRQYYVKRFQNLIKQACKITGLVPQHPETIKVLQEIIDKRKASSFNSFWLQSTKQAENVVRDFAKK